MFIQYLETVLAYPACYLLPHSFLPTLSHWLSLGMFYLDREKNIRRGRALAEALSLTDPQKIRQTLLQNLKIIERNFFDLVWSSKQAEEILSYLHAHRLKIEREDHLESVLHENGPTFFATLYGGRFHLGTWLAFQNFFKQKNLFPFYMFTGLYMKERTEKLFQVLNLPVEELHVLSLDSTPENQRAIREMTSDIHHGKRIFCYFLLDLPGDSQNGQNIHVPFFHKMASFSSTIGRLATLADCAILPYFILEDPHNPRTIHLQFSKPFFMKETHDLPRAKKIEAMMHHLISTVEEVIRNAPEQWHGWSTLEEFWKK